MATLRRYCVHSTLVPVVVPNFFSPHDWEIHMKELLLSNGRVLDGKRGKRGTRLAKIPHPEVCSFFFQISCTNPSQNHFFVPFVSGLSIFWCCAGTAVQDLANQLGTDYNRALCPAPDSCVCHALILNISLLLPFSISRHSGKPQQNHLSRPVLDGPGLCASGSGPLHTCTILFVCLSFMPPHFVPCFLTPHFFFLPLPPRTDPFFRVKWSH
jgi:hypothetical protein